MHKLAPTLGITMGVFKAPRREGKTTRKTLMHSIKTSLNQYFI